MVLNWTFSEKFIYVTLTWKTCAFNQISTMYQNWTQNYVKTLTFFDHTQSLVWRSI